MATANFYYQNRCIVVTDNDYECGNYPTIGELLPNYNRNFPSRYLAEYDFQYHDIIITSGYYCDACIDYDVNDNDVDFIIGGTQYYNTQADFFNECKVQFNLSIYKLRKICGNVGDMGIENYLENAYELLTDYLRSVEEIEVNKVLDKIKEEYGYEEVTCIGRASNGEAFYQKIS